MNNGNYVIEDGIEMPGARSDGSGLKPTLRRLKVGQSILVTNLKRNSVQSMAYAIKEEGMKFAVRMNKVGGGVRVWRIA